MSKLQYNFRLALAYTALRLENLIPWRVKLGTTDWREECEQIDYNYGKYKGVTHEQHPLIVKLFTWEVR